MSVKIKKSKHTIGQIIKNIDELVNTGVEVGIWGSGATPEDNLAYRMLVHEKGYHIKHAFGNGPPVDVKPRPVFKTTFEDYKKAANNFISKTIYPKLIRNEITAETARAMLGSWYEGKLKEQFVKRKFRRLSPHYKVRPSGAAVTPSSKPLMDTSDMRNAIKYKDMKEIS